MSGANATEVTALLAETETLPILSTEILLPKVVGTMVAARWESLAAHGFPFNGRPCRKQPRPAHRRHPAPLTALTAPRAGVSWNQTLQIVVEHHSSTAAYVVMDQTRYRLASDEAQAKSDEMLKQNRGKYARGEFERALAPIVAKRGIISEARLNAIANGGKVKEVKQPRP